MPFKLKVSTIRLNTKKLQNWECNYKHYDTIPDDISYYLHNKEKYNYFNKNLLLPGVHKKIPYHSMKIDVGHTGYYLRLTAELKDYNEPGIKPNEMMEITLTKNI
jgi:hypothetical protein